MLCPENIECPKKLIGLKYASIYSTERMGNQNFVYVHNVYTRIYVSMCIIFQWDGWEIVFVL